MPGWYSQKHSEPKILKNSPELCSTGEFALIFYAAKMKLYTLTFYAVVHNESPLLLNYIPAL